MKTKRIFALLLALFAIAFWLSVDFYASTGTIMIGLKAINVNAQWAPLGGLLITLAGIALSIWALRRWSK